MKSFQLTGNYFRNARLEAELTQQEVATKLGYTSKQIVSNWERGKCAPPHHQLRALAKMLKVDKENIFDVMVKAYVWHMKKVLGMPIPSKSRRLRTTPFYPTHR